MLIKLSEEYFSRMIAVMNFLEACCRSPVLWENISDCLQEAILVADLEGRILSAGPGVNRVLGFTAEELKDSKLSILFTPEDLTCFYPNLLYLARHFRIFEDEIMLMRKDGARFIAFLKLRTCSDPDQNRTLMIVSAQDIDKQKQMERFFEQSHYEDLIKIANGIAHEIRNPLVGIGGFMNRLLKVSSDPSGDHLRYHEQVINNLRKIECLVQKVEFFAQLPKPDFTIENMENLIQEALRTHLKRLQQHRIQVDVNVEETNLYLDKELVTRVFSILIENGIDAVAEGGKILICGRTTKNQCTVTVSDNGTGIQSEDLPYVFNPFFSTKPAGTGMDLATVKRIMKTHGGYVEVKSMVGRGTTFVLHFPIERRRSIRVSLLEDKYLSETGRNLTER